MSGRLFKSTAVVGGNTLISRVLGLARDIIIARFFGAGAGTDAFFVAFKIPNFFRRLFAEGAFSQAFIPVLAETRVGDKEELSKTRDLVINTMGTLGGVLVLLTLLAELTAPWLIIVFGPGFYLEGGEKYDLTVQMLRITFPYLLLISLTGLAGAVLNSFGRFAVAAFTPVLLNLSLIGAAIWLAPMMDDPVVGLAWGVFIAGLVQLAFQLPFLARLGMLGWPRWGLAHKGVRKIMRLMLPVIIGSSVLQINLVIDTIIASFLFTGSVTWLYYADRMVEFPLGVFAIALSTVILPTLSRQHAESSPEQFAKTLDWALRLALVVGLPATLGLFLLAGPIMSSLFEYGDFAAGDVSMAALALMAYSIGLPAFILIKVLAPAYFSRQDTKTPVKIAIKAMFLNITLNVVFVVPMVYFGITGPHAGLALATGLAAWMNAWLLWRGLHQSGLFQAQLGWKKLIWQVLAGLLVMAGILIWGIDAQPIWSEWDWSQRVGQLLLWIAIGAVGYLVMLLVCGMRISDLRTK